MIIAAFKHAFSRRCSDLLELLHDPVCRQCGSALPTPPTSRLTLTSTLFCKPCLHTWGFCPPEIIEGVSEGVAEAVTTGHANIHALCQLTPALKKIIYGHKFYATRHHQRLLHRLWLHGQSVLVSLLPQHDVSHGPIWVISIPSRHRSDDDSPKPRLRPIEDLFASVCRGWSQPNAPVHYLGPTALTWQRDTWSQHRLTQRKERLTNMHQALQVNEALWQEQMAKNGPPKAIVVLDDLVTTGATAQAALRAITTWCQRQDAPQNISHIPHKVLALAYVPLE